MTKNPRSTGIPFFLPYRSIHHADIILLTLINIPKGAIMRNLTISEKLASERLERTHAKVNVAVFLTVSAGFTYYFCKWWFQF